jgi:hypothetical protein
MKGTIVFVPVKHGGGFDSGGEMGIWGVSGKNKVVGFKPSPGRKREGWIVVLVTTKGKSSRPHRML